MERLFYYVTGNGTKIYSRSAKRIAYPETNIKLRDPLLHCETINTGGLL